MARCKMDQPERAAYLRVFCAHLLTDEDYETLNREQFGSVCFLMFHMWAKQGSLPNDPAKLAALARCTVEEFEDLRKSWPKLVPLESLDPDAIPGARVTIPYLWREWIQVMGFYEDQKKRSAQGVAARKAASRGTPLPLDLEEPQGVDEPMGDPMGIPMGYPLGAPMGIPNQDQAQDQDQAQAKAERKDSPPEVAPDPLGVVSIWNEAISKAKLPKAKLTEKRERVIRTRLKEKGWIDDFRAACAFLAGSEWHQGKNDRGWVANLDFALQAGKATELAERAQTQGGNHGISGKHRFEDRDRRLQAQLDERKRGETSLPEVREGVQGAGEIPSSW